MLRRAKAEPAARRCNTGRGAFSRRISLAFAVVAALTALLAATFISSVWNIQFERYVKDNLQRVADGVSTILGQTYPHAGGWTVETLSVVPSFGSMRGVVVQVLDESGSLIYDGTEACLAQAATADEVDQDFVLNPNGPVVTSPVTVAGEDVGTVRVWVFGQNALNSTQDEQFRRGSFAALAVAACIAVLFASITGRWYAGRLVRPIGVISSTALALREGDAGARTKLEGDDEIAELGRTFDAMADAIEADRELERRLTADVAHELRTPLQAIQATVEAMQDGVLPADEEHLGTVRNETVRLARLADAILELTRLERGSLPFEMQRIPFAGPVRAAVDAHAMLLEAAELSLTLDVRSEPQVIGDIDRLQQAVGNLLSNAARYTPAGGTVRVEVGVEDGAAYVAVDDTGIGISDEDLPHLFSRFWRADDARARTTGGLGIGLAVTKEIVERHGGTIGAHRRAEVGSRFTIRVPLASAADGARAPLGV